jgi:hypothetical protein
MRSIHLNVGDRSILKFFPDLEHYRQTLEKGRDAVRIEMSAAVRFHIIESFIDRPCILVRPRAGQRVEHVGEGNDSPHQWDVLARSGR